MSGTRVGMIFQTGPTCGRRLCRFGIGVNDLLGSPQPKPQRGEGQAREPVIGISLALEFLPGSAHATQQRTTQGLAFSTGTRG